MDVSLDSVEIHSEDVHFVWLHISLQALCFAVSGYIFEVFILIEIGDIAAVEDVVDILQHLLINNLRVDK